MDAIKTLEDVLAKTAKNTSNENKKRAVEALQTLFAENGNHKQGAEYLIKLHYSVCQAFFEELCSSASEENTVTIAEALVNDEQFKKGKRLRHENTRNIDSSNRLTVDIDFDNAGQAARFVTGKQINGLEEWQTDEGVTLKQFVDSSHTSVNAVLAENNNEQSVGDEFTNKKPISVILFGESHPVTYWRDVLICTCEVLYSKTPQIVCSFDKSGSLNKKRPTFSWRKEVVKQQPKQLSFGLWVELNQSAQTTVRICEKMLIECGFAPKDLKVIAKRYDPMAFNPKN